ncbi:MAG TPA: hypothetical protein VNZ64_04755 [Candidatus Acidoferrum sp.]|jgi:hypothetical protein|nr:hypothetical protein [Candidatus Acidoferrum sp.]
MMGDYQKEAAFLRQCLHYDDTAERHKLVESITQLQGNERCVRRALWLMILLGALAVAGLGYSAVFLGDYPQELVGSMTQFITQLFCVLGLASMICMPVFLGLGAIYRKEMNQRLDECRQLAAKLLESRLGNPRAPDPRMILQEREPRPSDGPRQAAAQAAAFPRE